MKSHHIVLLIGVVCLLVVIICSWKYSESFAGDKGYYKITWDPPADTGGSEISFYSVSIKNSDGVEVLKRQIDAPSTTYNFGYDDEYETGEWNEEYTVDITATNKDGKTSDPASSKWNSGVAPNYPINVQYSDGKTPITVKTNPKTTNIMMSLSIKGFKPGKDIGYSLYLFRGGNKICNPDVVKSSVLGDDITVSFQPCSELTSFVEGDVLKGSVWNYINDRGDTVKWTDPTGYTVPSSSTPAKVTNVVTNYVYPYE